MFLNGIFIRNLIKFCVKCFRKIYFVNDWKFPFSSNEFFRCNNSERKNFSHPFSALQSLKIRLLLKLFSFFPQYEPEKGFLKDSNLQILFCNFVISHICSTYSSCQKDSALLMMEMQCTVKEWAFIIHKKAHNITNTVRPWDARLFWERKNSCKLKIRATFVTY